MNAGTPDNPRGCGPAPRAAQPLRESMPGNPFPGIAALERRTGIAITARLSANEALPLYSEQLAERYGQDLLEQVRCYPDPAAFELRQCLAARHGLAPENLLVDAGADALIFLFSRAFTDPGCVVLHSAGSYPTFEYFARSLGLRPQAVNYQMRDGVPYADLAQLANEARRTSARVVYLANPDNPTGSEHSSQAVEAFARTLPAGTLLILDEAYEAFGNGSGQSLLPNMVRLRSFSKAFGLAGARVGYAMAPAAMLEIANRARIHYAVGTFAQQLALHALEQETHQNLVIAATQALKAHFMELARAAGVEVFPSATNFVTLPAPSLKAAQALRDRLLGKGASIYLGRINDYMPLVRISLQPELFDPHVCDLLFHPVKEVPHDPE